jgi:hypothetical protein
MKNNPIIMSSCIPMSHIASWNQATEEVQMLGKLDAEGKAIEKPEETTTTASAEKTEETQESEES